jgi:hypothetical protein
MMLHVGFSMVCTTRSIDLHIIPSLQDCGWNQSRSSRDSRCGLATNVSHRYSANVIANGRAEHGQIEFVVAE